MKRGLTALLLLSASGCFYSFDNPVELQDAGSIAGRVTFTDPSSGLTPGGGQVGLLWTDLAITVQDDGRFLFLGLPDGVYTLKYELDPGDGGLPLIAYRPDITLPREPGNVPDAIDLGTIALNPAARVTGHVTGLTDGGTAVVGAFSIDDAGNEIFESFTTLTDTGGDFTLDLPAGSHDIWVSTDSVSGSVVVSVPSGQVTDLGEVTLAPPAGGSGGSPNDRGARRRGDPNSGDANGELIGDLVLGLPGFGASADPGAVADAGLVQSNVEINPPPPPQDPFSLGGQDPGVGAHMDQTLPPGQLFPAIYCGLKGSQPPGPETLNDISLTNIPTFVGHSTVLGQITWLPVATFAANGLQAPPDYASSTSSSTTGTSGTVGTSGASSASGTTGGGSSTGGASSSGTGGTGTSGGVIDAGPTFHGWQELAEMPVADGGTEDDDMFIPIPSPGGPQVFYSNDQILYLAASLDGGLVPSATLDTFGGYLQLLAATTDELGVPSALLKFDPPLQETYSLTVAQPGPGGQWFLDTCESSSYIDVGQAFLLAAPAGSAEDGGPSLYAFFVDSNSQLNLATIYPGGKGCLAVPVNSPSSGDAGIGYFQDVAGASCTLNGDPGVCLALAEYADTIDAIAIDLLSPPDGLTDPVVIWTLPNGPFQPLSVSAVVTGPPLLQQLNATWYEGYVDPAPGQIIGQQVPVQVLIDGDAGFLPPPVYVDAGYDPDSGSPLFYFYSTLALSSAGQPFVLAQGRSNAVATFVPPLQTFAFDLTTGAPFPDLSSDAGVAAEQPAGFIDDEGNAVVGLAADDGTTLNAQIWTYFP